MTALPDSNSLAASHDTDRPKMLGMGTPFCDDARKPAMIGSEATSSARVENAGMRGSAS